MCSCSVHGNPFSDGGTAELLRGLVAANLSARERTAKEKSDLDALREGIHQITMDVVRDELMPSGQEWSIEDALGGGLNLQQLDVGDCGMGPEAASAMADLLRANTPLAILSLTGNKGVSIDGWREVALALASNTHVDTISLDYNQLGDEGVKAIVEGLVKNSSVKSLDLEGNKIGDEGAAAIINLLRMNDTLRDVTLSSGNLISEALLAEVKSTLKK
jgi:Ran GTPase-activating protein (RanGAP) involved in mRNA processing and transport